MTKVLPHVSIVIACRNEEDYIEKCLRSILAQGQVPGGIEIIVTDGMSTDKTRPILDGLSLEDSRILVIDNPRRIVSAGLNAGISAARGKIIIRMDAHTEYAPDYVRQCLAVLKETGADNVGGPCIPVGKGFMGQAIAATFGCSLAAGGAAVRDSTYEGPVDTAYLGCWPRQVFDRFGLFDEEFVRNQDDEFNLRLTRAGGKIWQSPRIKSWYHSRDSLSALFWQYRQYGYWKVRVIQKHKMPASVRHLVPGCFVLSMILMPLAALLWSPIAWGWLSAAGAYLTFTLVGSLITAGHHGWRLFPILPIVFGCYHFAFGYGFLCGIRDFVILRRTPNYTYTKLTRIPVGKFSHGKTLGPNREG